MPNFLKKIFTTKKEGSKTPITMDQPGSYYRRTPTPVSTATAAIPIKKHTGELIEKVNGVMEEVNKAIKKNEALLNKRAEEAQRLKKLCIEEEAQRLENILEKSFSHPQGYLPVRNAAEPLQAKRSSLARQVFTKSDSTNSTDIESTLQRPQPQDAIFSQKSLSLNAQRPRRDSYISALRNGTDSAPPTEKSSPITNSSQSPIGTPSPKSNQLNNSISSASIVITDNLPKLERSTSTLSTVRHASDAATSQAGAESSPAASATAATSASATQPKVPEDGYDKLHITRENRPKKSERLSNLQRLPSNPIISSGDVEEDLEYGIPGKGLGQAVRHLKDEDYSMGDGDLYATPWEVLGQAVPFSRSTMPPSLPKPRQVHQNSKFSDPNLSSSSAYKTLQRVFMPNNSSDGDDENNYELPQDHEEKATSGQPSRKELLKAINSTTQSRDKSYNPPLKKAVRINSESKDMFAKSSGFRGIMHKLLKQGTHTIPNTIFNELEPLESFTVFSIQGSAASDSGYDGSTSRTPSPPGNAYARPASQPAASKAKKTHSNTTTNTTEVTASGRTRYTVFTENPDPWKKRTQIRNATQAQFTRI